MNPKKFTLIEVLVIIAIIGILMTLLLPSLTQARLKAQQAVCLSNQHQIGVASITYIIENNHYAPHNTSDSDGWINKINGKYVSVISNRDTNTIFKCPSGADKSSTVAMNSLLTSGNYGNQQTPKLMAATGSETVMLIDSFKWWSQTEYDQMVDSKVLNSSKEWRIARHILRVNLTYLDGHSTSKSASFLLSKNDQSDTFWNPLL
ncbi:MAG: type II secretion system GspH family protein [Lentisphaeraceae bacterium]|nr:type II secretion system GspH family protein [Lentisphaeraceae bacterium]